MAIQLRQRPASGRVGRIRLLSVRHPQASRLGVAFAAIVALMLVVQYAAFAATRIPVEVAISGQDARVRVDGRELRLQLTSTPTRVVFVPGSPLLREYQIDGTDNTNNFTEDAGYVARMTDRPYFRFQDWMRDSASYSSWRNVTVRDTTSGGHVASPVRQAGTGGSVGLPAGRSVVVSADLMRLEVPAQVLVVCGAVPCAQVSLNRNDRFIQAAVLLPDGTVARQSQVFFPMIALPFAAEVVYLLAHAALWSLALLAALVGLQCALSLAVVAVKQQMPAFESDPSGSQSAGGVRWIRRLRARDWDRLALAGVAMFFAFTCYIALAQYQAQPHILDASAYVMQAKIFASGRLAAPVPANLDAFQGPFMVAHDGRWFAQYPPGTSLLLAVGYVLRVPWVIEPLLGAFALWGIYRLGRAWYGRATAWVAILLGALSPFLSYLAAAYLSHVPALFFEVFFLLCLTRYVRRQRTRDLILAAACWSGLLLTRELSAALLGLAVPAYLAATHWRALWRKRSQLSRDGLAALGVALAACGLYLLYNVAQTGSALITPRALFSPADHPGFGTGIGFYGQHTLAAGLVNLDELLTSLSIDLYGWPFYLTLAFIPIAFLSGRAHRRWDLLCITTAALLALAQVTYFYHGIYLGPRYLFETLPFLLLLTARGITNLPRVIAWAGRHILPDRVAHGVAVGDHARARLLTGACVAALLLCNLLYYLPRQLALHENFSGLAVTQPVDVGAVYRMRPAHTVVVTDDWYLYNYVVWPLNDPLLAGTTLYAYAPSTDAMSLLRTEFRGRKFYQLAVDRDGGVRLVPLNP